MRRIEDERRALERHEERPERPPVAEAHALLALQRSAGNQAVARMLARVRHGQTSSQPSKKKNQKGADKGTKTDEGIDRNAPSTWTLNALRFGKKVSEADVLAAADGETILDSIRDGTITGIRLDSEFHHHLNAADWGIMVKYVLQDDQTVTPWVYDIATKRTGNKYHWSIGKPTSGNSPVQPPLKGQ